MGRSCGECTACCTEMGITELQKPPGEPCGFLKKEGCAGCSCYDGRPVECRTFECLWLGEPIKKHTLKPRIFWESDRPDKCGVLFHAAGGEFTRVTGFPVVVARGDFEKGAAVIKKIAKRALVILAHPDGRREMQGEPHVLEQAMAWSISEASR